MVQIVIAMVLFALLPLILAILFKTTVVPRRKTNMRATLESSQASECSETQHAEEYIQHGKDRMEGEFNSLYGVRFLFPAVILSIFYLCGLWLSTTLLAVKCSISCPAWFAMKVDASHYDSLINSLINPLFALAGCYVFNTGMLIRRAFIADITKNVFWASINRLVIAIGFAVAFSPLPSFIHMADKPFFFSIAFVPGVFTNWLRKTVARQLSPSSNQLDELDIQLVQGIDIWKEERLEEEGIDGVQNLATADALTLAVKTHFPLRTIVDWIDQAILIQHFPQSYQALQQGGMAISAIEFALVAKRKDDALLGAIAAMIKMDKAVLLYAMECMCEDEAVQNIWRIWQARNTGGE